MSNKIVLCTGANQGLGFAIIQLSALRYSDDTYILCSRDLSAGQKAVKKLRDVGVTAKIDLVQLEVTNDEQIGAAVEHVSTTYGKLDVLINNAGILRRTPEQDENLTNIRNTYNQILSVNLTSVAVICAAFAPLLYKSRDPKVINVSSGLGSIQNALTKKMGRSVPYGTSKVGLNGLTAHLQVLENDRVQAEEGSPESGLAAHMRGAGNGRGQVDAEKSSSRSGKPKIRYFACQPGVLKTAFSNYFPQGKDPVDGAEVVVRLLGDDEGKYEGGSYWEFVDGEMKVVPW
ncbi:short chain dehydrogenase/reductase family protein [Paecilomyces variotii No. 5]|uniref:Short chain dehydrogenase/reductase family protein n=1 Tax=Byssochlamys spectabilis (strain No. 5 / NBRC 109023) TaxID=1356009 RepID=V5FRK5_BYSSN|nr:short chain dehydrogenase/reductase family protein [Paecilomyces variotii No. 5]